MQPPFAFFGMYGFDGFCVFHPYKISLAKEKRAPRSDYSLPTRLNYCIMTANVKFFARIFN